MVRTKPEIIQELDEILGYNLVVGLKDGAIPDTCAFCIPGLSTNEPKYRINKYRFCEKHWKMMELFIELK
jgi:hypothetical protein